MSTAETNEKLDVRRVGDVIHGERDAVCHVAVVLHHGELDGLREPHGCGQRQRDIQCVGLLSHCTTC